MPWQTQVNNEELAVQIKHLRELGPNVGYSQTQGFLKKWIGNINGYDSTQDAAKIQAAVYAAEVIYPGVCNDSNLAESVMDYTIRLRDDNSGIKQEQFNKVLQRMQQFYRDDGTLNEALKSVTSMARD